MSDKLTDEQKERALELFEEFPDLNVLVKKISGDENLDGRCKLGRDLRSFLARSGKDYAVKGNSAKGGITELTENQRKFLMSDAINAEMSPLEIARLTFKNEEIKTLTSEHRIVLKFLGEYRSDIIDHSALLADGKWQKPACLLSVITKVNKWCNLELSRDESQIPNKERKGLQKLLNYLQGYKIWSTINSFNTQDDRDLFESEFVRATWDKPDLTAEELNQYMMVCSNYVRAKHIQRRLDSFHVMMENEDLAVGDISIKLTEHCKAINEELNACEKRITDLVLKLNGTRSERIKQLQNNNANILALVEAFQNKDERDQMVLAADMRSKLIEEEATRLESMDEFRARIFGISMGELI